MSYEIGCSSQMASAPTQLDGEAKRIQDERKEYVKNLGIEYRFGCYEEKRADSCQLLAEYMEALDQNFKGALAIFKQNCEQREYGKSCFKYAMYLLAGKECTPDLKKMIRPLEIACRDNLPQGCRYLSLVHWNGEKDRAPDSKKAEEYMKKACSLDDGEACWLLSTWCMGPKTKFIQNKHGETKEQERGGLGHLDRDMEASLKYGIRACELDIPQSCANVARMLKLGDGVAVDEEAARKYLERAKELADAMKKNNTDGGFTG